ncbi:hypothetical protein AB0H82_10320 [Streptomyces sp. NPDC050732]|uniref:hypothetical protein n=1 Tax=Streptomyces sp. NPDC050732 TaxID=3154632 RepID=UPI003439B230
MRTHTIHPARLLLTLTLAAVGVAAFSGCGSDEDDGHVGKSHRAGQTAQLKDRARQVAEAWDHSVAAAEWRRGYHPMAAVVQLPENGLHNAADKRAYEAGTFDLRAKLPSAPRKGERVTWRNGGSLTLPLVTARATYQALDRDSSPGPRLTVTGAKLGTMTVHTSRGRATVPAWLFTLRGYDSPLKRAAVSPSPLPKSPVKSVGQVPTGVLTPLGGLVEVAGGGRTVAVVATYGSCNRPAVDAYETKESVVLSASTVQGKDGDCTTEMRAKGMNVRLDRPLGSRILLDAYTGRPVTNSKWPELAPMHRS